MIQIPDTEYDIDFWRDVDHEGVGGRRSENPDGPAHGDMADIVDQQ